MTQATEILRESRAPHLRIVGAVSAAHFVSHYYILLLAPLLPFVRAEYGVSYTEIGLALAAFNIVSTALQTPVGFLVDWLGARVLLIARLDDRRRRLRARRAGRFILGDGGDVRARRRRQHGLPPGRLRAAVAARAARPHRPGVFGAHLRRHARLGGGAGQPAADAERVGLARRLHRRRRARLCGGGDPAGGAREAARRRARAPARADDGQERGRLAAAAVGADPAQSVLLRAARDDQRRHLQLFGGGARRALRHAGDRSPIPR